MFRYILTSFLLVSMVAGAPVSAEWDADLATRENFYTLMRRQDCSTFQGCHDCLGKAGCGYSKTDFKCEQVGKSSANMVTTVTGCPQIDQLQGHFPAVNKDATHNPTGTKAGIHTPEVKQELDRIAGHVFHGAGSSDSKGGRHTSDSYEAANKGAKVTDHNGVTHITQYDNKKTAWDSAHYSEVDIRNMCAVALKLRLGAGKDIAAYVVQSPHGQPVCVETFSAGTGSCYPKGTGIPKEGLNNPC
ncbi:hypothetical protein CVT26_009442 [Gymnopilus dilepis]|uniref:SCP domain-containing protein n=1 Tax=Gymnopilus dilepis TaxID=231916 RepID=A0A409YI79_9AGAR|nr:hypothetical protein CVT26_009442 [Gymnopilus dilepis]